MTKPFHRSLAGLLAANAECRPDATALHHAGIRRSYGELADDCARRAACIVPADTRPGSIVAFAASGRELAEALLACNRAGHAFLPLDPATAELRWPVLASAGSLLRLDRLPPAEAGPLPLALPAADSPALVVATSGSEGSPKGVVLTHDALAAAADASSAAIPLRPEDTWLDCLPLHHIGGLSIFWRCFAAGAAISLHDSFDADAVWAEIAAGHASHVSLVPAMLARLLDAAGEAPPHPRLRCVLVGGAALSLPLHRRACAAGWPLHVSYGMTETAAQIALLPPGEAWHEGLVGRPLPGIELMIDEDGRICVRGRQRMRGYLGAAPLAADDWLRTGDLGRLDEAGRLHVLGRADDMLVSAGVNVHPAEVEARLAACPGVDDAAVTRSTDPVWGDVLTALVVGACDEASVAAWCREAMPASLRPRRVVRVAVLPRNAMGKLERRRLPELLPAAESA